MNCTNFNVKIIIIYVCIGIALRLAFELIRLLHRNGIFRRLFAWFNTSRTGKFIRRILAVLAFLLLGLFIVYFFYTGTKI